VHTRHQRMVDAPRRNPSSLTGTARGFDGRHKYACVSWKSGPATGPRSV
jgi:hypothetical protein